jgi:hypothetical protein
LFKYRYLYSKCSYLYTWWPCLLMDWDEMSNLYRGPSIDASYQVSVHLVEGFQRHISVIQFRYHLWKVIYKDCSFRPDWFTNIATTENSCFWLVNFWKIFSVKRKITTDDRRRTPSNGKSSHCLWKGELKTFRIATASWVCTVDEQLHCVGVV